MAAGPCLLVSAAAGQALLFARRPWRLPAGISGLSDEKHAVLVVVTIVLYIGQAAPMITHILACHKLD